MTKTILSLISACDAAPGEALKLRKHRKGILALHAAAEKDPATPEHIRTLLFAARPVVSASSVDPQSQKALRAGLRALGQQLRAALKDGPPSDALAPDAPAPEVVESVPPPPSTPPALPPALLGWELVLVELEATLPAALCTPKHPARAALRSAVELELRAQYAAHIAARIAAATADRTADRTATPEAV